MYFEEAVKRINSIDWEKFGTNERRDEEGHVSKYLHRLEELIRECVEGTIPIHPLYCANVAKYLGDTETVNIADYCSPIVLERTENHRLVQYVIEWYLQLVKYAECNEMAEKYVDVFDSLITLLESGRRFFNGDGGINVPGTGYWPLHGWYSRVVKGVVQKEEG